MFAKKIYPIVNTNAIWSSGFVFKGLITRKFEQWAKTGGHRQ